MFWEYRCISVYISIMFSDKRIAMAAAYHVWKIWRQEQALQTYHDNNDKSSCKAVQTHLQEMAKAEVREHATLFFPWTKKHIVYFRHPGFLMHPISWTITRKQLFLWRNAWLSISICFLHNNLYDDVSRWYPVIKKSSHVHSFFLLNHVLLLWSHGGVLFYGCTISLLLQVPQQRHLPCQLFEHFHIRFKRPIIKSIWHSLYIVLQA